MTWEQLYRLKLALRTSLVFWMTIALVAALVASPVVRSLDRETNWKLFDYSPDGARAVLGALLGSMLTFIVFVLSATLIVVQLASGQLTPRIIGIVFAMPWVRSTLMIFTFTFAYTLAVLGRVEERVPDFHVGVAVLLNLLCIVVFFQFVQRLSNGLRPSTLMQIVADRGREVINDVYPLKYDPARPELPVGESLPNAVPQVVEHSGRTGVVMAFSVSRLIDLARAADAVIEVMPQVGDSVAPGDPLFRVFGGKPLAPDALHACLAVGIERTMDQDPRFAFRILVDIANRALSPAINDPTTAVLALDQLNNLLYSLGRRRLDEGVARDAAGKVRVVYGTPDWPDYVILAVTEIRQYGAGSLQIGRRMRAMLEHLIRELPESRRPPLEQELALLGSSVERGFSDEEDRKRASKGDYQGVGGSDS